MFHKEGSVQGGSKKAVDVALKKSDRRHLRQRAVSYFWNDQDDDDTEEDAARTSSSSPSLHAALDEIFLKGNLSSRSLPAPGGNKAWTMVLYLKTKDSTTTDSQYWPYKTSSQFVWMALQEKNRVVHETPTVALWGAVFELVKDLTAYSVVIPSAASKYLCRGADLLRPGILQVPSSAIGVSETAAVQLKSAKSKKQQSTTSSMVAISVRGNPQPFAVGLCKLNAKPGEEPQQLFGPGTKGVGVEIYNCYGDDLWRTSVTKEQLTENSHDDGKYGNAGFIDGKYVLPLVAEEEDDEDYDGEKSVTGDEASGTAVSNDSKDNNVGEVVDNPSPSISEENQQQPLSNTGDSALQPEQQLSGTGDDGDDASTGSPDEVLHNAFCQALVNLKNKDLPISTGTFYAQHVLPNRQEGTNINLKATTWKKFSNYLKEQVTNGLIQVGPDTTNKANTDPMAFLNSYNKKHEDLKSFAKTSAGDGDNGNNKNKKLVLVSLYIIPNHWSQLLRLDQDDVKATNATSEERKGTGMLTAKEVRVILDKYIEREELGKNAPPGSIDLDGALTDVLYGKKKQTDTIPDRISLKDLAPLYTSKHLPAYGLVEMPGSKIVQLSKGNPPKVEIEVSRRQSNKFVTRVRGLEHYSIDPSYFCKDVTKRLAVSGTVDNDPASSGRAALRKGHVELVFGANIVDELEALLTGDESLSSHGGVKNSDYSIPIKVIDVSLKKGVPARKRAGGAGKKKK